MKEDKTWIYQLNSVLIKHPDGDRKLLQFAQDDYDSIVEWVGLNILKPVEKFNNDSAAIYRGLRLPLLKMWIPADHKDFDGYMHIMNTVAGKFFDKVRFTWVDASDKANDTMMMDLGLTKELLPRIAFNLRTDEILPYPIDHPINTGELLEWVTLFVSGGLKPYRPTETMESADPEIEEKFQSVHALTRDEYEDDVLYSDYDVCVMFYNSVYPHDMLKPIAHQFALAEKILTMEGYPMAKAYRYDVAKNPVPLNIDETNLPAIFFYPSSRKDPPYA